MLSRIIIVDTLHDSTDSMTASEVALDASMHHKAMCCDDPMPPAFELTANDERQRSP